ncbi:MAG: 6-hydroxymethylpterin diphosphokinase MptE-like protein, partial [Chlamydiota bacterium]
MASKTANFQDNIRLWSTYMSQESEEIKNVTPQRVSFCDSDQGLPNLKTKRQEETYFYHDPNDPLGEAHRWFKTLDLANTDVVYVYGVGLGYYYDALANWLHSNPNRYLAFIEDDPEVVYRFLESDRAKTILQDRQVRLFYISNFKKGVGKVSKVASCFMGLQFKISAVQLYLRQKAQTLMRLHTMLSFLMKMYEVTHYEYSSFSVPFFLNYYINLFTLPSSYLAANLWGQWKGVPAIICGAGPSLNKNIETLRTLQDRALIIGGSTSMNALNAGGITPHLGVGIDPNPAQLTRIVSNSSYQTPYFCNFRLNSFALNAIHGDHLYVNSGETYEVANWVDKQIGIGNSGALEGYNVLNYALSLTTLLGCNPIIVVGVDLAYSQEESYAQLPHIHPMYHGEQTYTTKSSQEDLVARKDIYGETVFTLWKWLLESVWYSKFALQYPTLEIINSTEGGIGFPGVENVPLKEVAEKHLEKQYDFDGMIHSSIQSHCQMPSEVNEDKIADILRNLHTSMNKCHDHCKLIGEEYKKMIASIGEGVEYPFSLVNDNITDEVLKLDQEEAYQNILFVYNTHIMQVMKKEIQKLELDKDWLDVDEVSQETAELHSVRFNLLKEASEKNIKLIENALGAYQKRVSIKKSYSSVSQKDYPIVLTETSDGDVYSIEEGTLTIKDDFLDINISEDFKGEPCKLPEDIRKENIDHSCYSYENQLHGPSVYRTKEGAILSTTWYYKGRKIGRAERYYHDGSLYCVNRYKNGNLHGPQDYFYRDGVVRSQIIYTDGELDGAVLLFFPNGQMKREIYYKNGKKHGKEILWNFEGKKIGEFSFEENQPTGTGRVWSPSGNVIKEVSYVEGVDEGTVKLWTEKGEEIHFPEEQGKDYFDLVAIKMETFTQNLNQIVESLETLGPILEKENKDKAHLFFGELKKDVKLIKDEIKKLLELNKKLKKEAG